MKRFVWCSAAVLLLLSGCVHVDYVGQTFDPIPEGEAVTFFKDRGEIKPGKYRIIGRGVVSTTWRLDKYDIQEFLIDEARKRGADAVALVEHKRIRRGVYAGEMDAAVTDTAPAIKSSNITPSGEPLEVSFDRSEPLRGEHHTRQELKLRVLFLKDKEALEQQLARRGRELDQLVKQPDPAGKTAPDKNEKPEEKR